MTVTICIFYMQCSACGHFICRWRYKGSEFKEQQEDENGDTDEYNEKDNQSTYLLTPVLLNGGQLETLRQRKDLPDWSLPLSLVPMHILQSL